LSLLESNPSKFWSWMPSLASWYSSWFYTKPPGTGNLHYLFSWTQGNWIDTIPKPGWRRPVVEDVAQVSFANGGTALQCAAYQNCYPLLRWSWFINTGVKAGPPQPASNFVLEEKSSVPQPCKRRHRLQNDHTARYTPFRCFFPEDGIFFRCPVSFSTLLLSWGGLNFEGYGWCRWRFSRLSQSVPNCLPASVRHNGWILFHGI